MMVASIVQIAEHSTHYLYRLNDNTGEIDAKVRPQRRACAAAWPGTLRVRTPVSLFIPQP